jgi:putative phosphoesterase
MIITHKIIPKANPFIIGVVSDSHIPDRVKGLHPFLLSELKSHKVHLILHAGDISIKRILEELAAVAPVWAVAGNRDWLQSRELPQTLALEIFGLRVILTHGHMGMRTYWLDKWENTLHGYKFERYLKRFEAAFTEARVIVFGHSHHIENRWIDKKLYFNPGSVSQGDASIPQPYFGLLKFYEDGRIDASLQPLTGAVIRNKKWEITR